LATGMKDMDYKELVKRIDEIQMSPRDRAAAKVQLAHAERLVGWTLAAAGTLRRSYGKFADASLRPAFARLRSSFDRVGTA
jgi:hypothetical protein